MRQIYFRIIWISVHFLLSLVLLSWIIGKCLCYTCMKYLGYLLLWISYIVLLCFSLINFRCMSEMNSVFVFPPSPLVFLLNLVTFQVAGVEISICSLVPDPLFFLLLFYFLCAFMKVSWRVPMITLKTLHALPIVSMKFLSESKENSLPEKS